MVDFIGWAASLLFSLCGLPQAIQSYKDGHAAGVSSLFLLMWGLGEILMIVYVFAKHGLDLPLLVNYVLNLLFIAVVTKYKIFPRRKDESK